jgi:hypothetical protein
MSCHKLSVRRKCEKRLWLNESGASSEYKIHGPNPGEQASSFLLMIAFNADIRSPQFKNFFSDTYLVVRGARFQVWILIGTIDSHLLFHALDNWIIR